MVVGVLADVVEDIVASGTGTLFIIVSFDGLFASCCNDDKPNNNASTSIGVDTNFVGNGNSNCCSFLFKGGMIALVVFLLAVAAAAKEAALLSSWLFFPEIPFASPREEDDDESSSGRVI